MPKVKDLQYWNGGQIYAGKYRGCHICVAAYSQAEAVRIICEATGYRHITVHVFKDHYSKCCGNGMEEFKPVVPSVYAQAKGSDNYELIYELK